MKGKQRHGVFSTKHIIILSAIGTIFVILGACTASATSAVSSGEPAKSSQKYGFDSDATRPTNLLFTIGAKHIPYRAEVRNSAGEVVASLNNGALETVSLTLPVGKERYELEVASDEEVSGNVKVSLTYGSNASAPNVNNASAMPVAYRAPADCRLLVEYAGGVNLRVSPSAAAAVIGVLPQSSQYKADVRTLDGWYHVLVGDQTGWVMGDAIRLDGMCSNLPVQTSGPATPTQLPALGGAVTNGPTAAYDVDIHYFGISADGGGQFADAVSYPYGDGIDRILVSALAAEGQAWRAYALVLFCDGNGTNDLRWGSVNAPNLTCADAMTIPFSTEAANLDIVVMIPGGVEQRFVSYKMRAMPVALDDAEQMPLALDRNSGGRIGNSVSYPGGDHTDILQLFMPNLEAVVPNNYRDVTLMLTCSGTGIENLRWGTLANPVFGCNMMGSVPLSYLANLQNITVFLPPNSPQSYIEYTLVAVPAAPSDSDGFSFGIDRDAGGQFNEMISFPGGDKADMLDMSISNLSEHPPNNFRTVTMQLQCDGLGAEHVLWGPPGNVTLTCGSILKAPFLHGSNRLPLLISLPDTASQSYVMYRLVAIPES